MKVTFEAFPVLIKCMLFRVAYPCLWIGMQGRFDLCLRLGPREKLRGNTLLGQCTWWGSHFQRTSHILVTSCSQRQILCGAVVAWSQVLHVKPRVLVSRVDFEGVELLVVTCHIFLFSSKPRIA